MGKIQVIHNGDMSHRSASSADPPQTVLQKIGLSLCWAQMALQIIGLSICSVQTVLQKTGLSLCSVQMVLQKLDGHFIWFRWCFSKIGFSLCWAQMLGSDGAAVIV